MATFLVVFAWRGAPSLSGWEYKDVIGILLTTVTVVVAGLALFLGLAAVWGYQKISEEASKDAIKAMQLYLRSDEFFGIVSSIVSDRMKGDMQAILASRVITEEIDGAPPSPDEPWVE
ncbi:hypothetical protein [Caulobacter sp. Root487D2Y]|uniref:hypothetical protein n=1 Tax=Caulobacter sp. Root487D2Y TaxID=1736547 RepID=UPI0012E38FDA|nr:hypothetical protein [Caulobacter sp. Root487D2Y]